MKRIAIHFLYGMLLCACSIDGGLFAPAASPVPTRIPTLTPTQPPTPTPTIPSPTFTLTPTLSGQKTRTPTAVLTPTVSSITPLALVTPNTPTPRIGMQGFVNVFTSIPEFYKPGPCGPSTVKFTAQVANPPATAFVQLFVRFKSKRTGTTGEWTSIKMGTLGGGTFVYELSALDMKGADSFKSAWVQYQLVATDASIVEIGRTDIFGESLSLLECLPTPTPTGTATPTPSSSPSPSASPTTTIDPENPPTPTPTLTEIS